MSLLIRAMLLLTVIMFRHVWLPLGVPCPAAGWTDTVRGGSVREGVVSVPVQHLQQGQQEGEKIMKIDEYTPHRHTIHTHINTLTPYIKTLPYKQTKKQISTYTHTRTHARTHAHTNKQTDDIFNQR